jgi:hypothetical protein
MTVGVFSSGPPARWVASGVSKPLMTPMMMHGNSTGLHQLCTLTKPHAASSEVTGVETSSVGVTGSSFSLTGFFGVDRLPLALSWDPLRAGVGRDLGVSCNQTTRPRDIPVDWPRRIGTPILAK